MGTFLFDTALSGAEELAAVLDDNGVDYTREDQRFYFRFSSKGCAWQMIGQGIEDRLLIYAVHPSPVRDTAAALETCSFINSQVVSGGCFLHEERIVFRTDARLIEACAAREMILQALEYSAGVMTTFWSKMSQGAAGLSLKQSFDAKRRV